MNRILILISLFLPSCVFADTGDIWFSPYMHTKHFRYHDYVDGDEVHKYQDSHPSIGIEYENSNSTSLSTGLYNDSHGRLAFFAAKRWAIGYGVGISSGILITKTYYHGFVPFVGPDLTVSYDRAKLALGYIPSFGSPGTANLLVMKLSIRM